jgi:hypothetical protein
MDELTRVERLRQAVKEECEELARRRKRARELAGTVHMGEFQVREGEHSE